ncbi:MAG TPA: cupredoxin domain-containing protein [Gaiellaceae bacterium]|nr:cupredoxin domain-containing protein [Gaiellaceae bacterium]
MFKGMSILLAAGALAFFPATASAATVTVQIKSTGFSPSTLTINHGDRITWHNADTVDHQVVADNGAFASPILHRGQSWAVTLNVAGIYKYHDALYPRRTGKVTVNGPPPSVTLALSLPIVNYGTQVTLSGAISTGAVGQSVEIDAQPYGQASPVQLVIVKTGVGGAYSYPVQPAIYTTYVARWGKVASGSVVVQVAPTMHLLPGENGYMRATISSPVSLWHKHVYLQRLSSLGQWVNIVALDLGSLNGRLFQPTAYLPKGVSHIRVFLSVNQAGNGLLAAHSGTQTIRRVR